MNLMRYIPKAYLSWGLGHLARMPLPPPLAALTIKIFARAYSIDPSLALQPFSSFRCIGDFFVRDLRPELRPICGPIACPVDGTLRSCSDISATGTLTQVKGKEYSLRELLGNDPCAEKFLSGQMWNFYLSPQDAHHIHAPSEGHIVKTVHVPGMLWPVNDWAISNVDRLFVVNERVVSFIETSSGLLAVVMVGATNVGRIAVAYTSIETNRAPWSKKQIEMIEHTPPIPVRCGEKIGTFKMGSSVVLLTERKLFDLSRCKPQRKVTFGLSLESLCRGS